MARPLRIEFPGLIYRVTARGNAREVIFRDDEDRAAFLDVLGREIAQQRWHLDTYCLTNNHYRVLVETPEPNSSCADRRVGSNLTAWKPQLSPAPPM